MKSRRSANLTHNRARLSVTKPRMRLFSESLGPVALQNDDSILVITYFRKILPIGTARNPSGTGHEAKPVWMMDALRTRATCS